MKSKTNRFGAVAQAVKDRTADSEPSSLSPAEATRAAGAGVHKPAAALALVTETLRERIARLELDLAQSQTEKVDLQRDLDQARSLRDKQGDSADEFVFLHPNSVIDHLPRDRLHGREEGPEFDALLADITEHGQNDAITVRPMPPDQFEIAAGRRRLAVCKLLNRPVLARVRHLDDRAMLRVQYSENERRLDISALERARWFAEVKQRLGLPSQELAAQFGVDKTTFSLYLRIARFPDAILERLYEPRRLAVLPARRVMESIETDPTAVQRILAALDSFDEAESGGRLAGDPGAQIEALLRAAEGRGTAQAAGRAPVPGKRHIVHQGRRIGTLTRNGGQWVFRFATSIPDNEVHTLAERLAAPVDDIAPAPAAASKADRDGSN